MRRHVRDLHANRICLSLLLATCGNLSEADSLAASVLLNRASLLSASKLDGLWDYGNKAWSGLVKGYYDVRYQLFADSKMHALLHGGGLDDNAQLRVEEQQSFLAAVMHAACEFGHTTGAELPREATGDALAIAKELHSKYAPKRGAM